jgi:hypothetical protein
MQTRIQRIRKVVIESSRRDRGAVGTVTTRQEGSYVIRSVKAPGGRLRFAIQPEARSLADYL